MCRGLALLNRVQVVVHMGALAVLLLLFFAAVVVAMGQLVVIVGMRMPVGFVVKFACNAASVLVGYVVVVVTMRLCPMRVVGFPAFALNALWCCHVYSPEASTVVFRRMPEGVGLQVLCQ